LPRCRKKTFNVLANHTNEVTVYTHDLEYTVIAPSELYSGGDLRQMLRNQPAYTTNSVSANLYISNQESNKSAPIFLT